MRHFSTVLGQLLQVLPWHEFDRQAKLCHANKYVKKMTAKGLLVSLLYAQARNKDSLRDIQTCMSIHGRKWEHLGVKTLARSTLSDANARTSSELFERVFYELLAKIHRQGKDKRFKFKNDLNAKNIAENIQIMTIVKKLQLNFRNN